MLFKQKDSGELSIVDADGEVMDVGRGESENALGYIALRNELGVLCYLYPNDTGDGIVVATVKP